MRKLVELFKTEITGEETKRIKISDEFYIAKYKSWNDKIVYTLYDDLRGSNYIIYAGKYDAFNDMKELNNNMKDFKAFFNNAIDEAFEARKLSELSKIKF